MTHAIVCILEALTPDERKRAAQLRRAIGEAMLERADLADGIALRVQCELQILAEWIALERRCCPFLSFELRWHRGEDAPWLALRGPDGTKEFLAREMTSGG